MFALAIKEALRKKFPGTTASNKGFLSPLPLAQQMGSVSSNAPVTKIQAQQITPTPTPEIYGRTDKANTIRAKSPDLYNQAVERIKNVGANPFETNLLVDIAAAENNLKPEGNNYKWPVSTSQGMYMFNNPTWGDYLKASESARLAGAKKLDPLEQTRAILFEIRNKRLSRWDASKSVWSKPYNQEELKKYYR